MEPTTLRPIGEITTHNGLHADNGGFGTLNVPADRDGSRPPLHRISFIYVDHPGVNHRIRTAREQNIEILKNRIRRADLNRLSKDRVMKCFGFVFDRPPCYYVVDFVQYRQWKPLLEVIEGRSIAQKLDLLRKAAETVSYLHSLDPRIVHGDLQPGAFVVSPDCGDVILRDFGLNNALRYLTADDQATNAGTATALGPWRAGYSSPQCIELLGEPNRDAELEPSDDVFAFAGIILKVLSGDGPHEAPLPPGPRKKLLQSNRMILIYSGLPPERNQHSNLPADDSLWDLLDSMWQEEREDRPSFADVIQKLKDESERRGSVVQHPLPSISVSAVSLTALASPQDSATDPPPIPDDHLSISQVPKIWSGRYSDVTQGSYNLRPEDDFWVPVAIKRLKCFYTSPSSQEETFYKLKRESKIWLELRNKYVLELYGYQTTPEPRLVSPWCAQGNLKNLIMNPNSVPVTLKRCVDLLLDVCKGVMYLHTRSPTAIVHGDIKPENVVIADDGHAMLCDFGLARIHRGQTGFTEGVGPTGTGTAGYIAPEVTEEWTQQKPADIWALGSTFLTCLTKKEPWDHLEKSLRWNAAVEQKIPSRESHPELPANNPLWGLMELCWTFEVAERPTIHEVLNRLKTERKDQFP